MAARSWVLTPRGCTRPRPGRRARRAFQNVRCNPAKPLQPANIPEGFSRMQTASERTAAFQRFIVLWLTGFENSEQIRAHFSGRGPKIRTAPLFDCCLQGFTKSRRSRAKGAGKSAKPTQRLYLTELSVKFLDDPGRSPTSAKPTQRLYLNRKKRCRASPLQSHTAPSFD